MASPLQQLFGTAVYRPEAHMPQPGDDKEYYGSKFVDINEGFTKTQMIGLFFAAPWSGPCHAWASVLQSFRQEVNNEILYFLDVILIPTGCGSA